MTVLPLITLVGLLVALNLLTSQWTQSPGDHFGEIKTIATLFPTHFTPTELKLLNQTVTTSMADRAQGIAWSKTIMQAALSGFFTLVFGMVPYFFGRIVTRLLRADPVVSPDQLKMFMSFVEKIMTVDGLILSITGGAILLSPEKITRFAMNYGFVILVYCLLLSFMASSAASSAFQVDPRTNAITIDSTTSDRFFDLSHLAFWYLVLGLGIIGIGATL